MVLIPGGIILWLRYAMGAALVRIAGIGNAAKPFFADSDARAVIRPVVEARPREIKDHEALSKSADGTF